MKKNRFLLLKGMVFGFSLILLTVGCTNEDDPINPPPPPGPGVSETELISKKTSIPPTLDGTIDAVWNNVQKLTTVSVVPDPMSAEDSSLFVGYVGDSYNVTMRSLYDDENIYFLVEWFDRRKDFDRQTWYFDPSIKQWKQESRYPTFNADDVAVRMPFYEDKFAFLWNVDNSVEGWDNSTCWASCHTGLANVDGLARHYTNGTDERIDMWHWKSVRTGTPNTQMDDQYQDDITPNGRHSDPKESGGYTNNVQELTVTGSSEVVNVPKYFIPGESYYYWIKQSEIDAGTAKEITGVDMNGILTYDGGAIDPYIDVAFQREGSIVGAKGIPSIFTAPLTGNRGDLDAVAEYTGQGWILEIKRKLDTEDTEKVDVNFASLDDHYFGIGVFDNAALAHAISANLQLRFAE